MAEKKTIRVGVDLDGVIARHALGGFWVWARKTKEKLLKKKALGITITPLLSLKDWVGG